MRIVCVLAFAACTSVLYTPAGMADNSQLSTTTDLSELSRGSATSAVQSKEQTALGPLPSISARHIRTHEKSGRELLRANIELSAQGLRVRQAVQGQRHREMLQDFINERAWLIDHRRSVAHRLPLEPVSADERLMPAPGDDASFLSQTPCGLTSVAHSAGNGRWRGRDVTAWHCKQDDDNIIAIEFLDLQYQIVVYRRTVDGQIDELSRLQDRHFVAEHFTPDESLRLVDRNEFFGSPAPVPRYENPEK